MSDHDEEDIKEGEPEIGDVSEIELPDGIEGEADFPIGSPVAAFEDDLGEDEDPHSSFDTPAVVSDDPHLDPYGVGAPAGFDDDEDEDDVLEEEELLSEADSY
jgi:hypothetical protein